MTYATHEDYLAAELKARQLRAEVMLALWSALVSKVSNFVSGFRLPQNYSVRGSV